jgi:hypothetical protein
MRASSTVEVIDSSRAVDDVIARVRAERASATARGERKPPRAGESGAPRSASAGTGTAPPAKHEDRPHLGRDGAGADVSDTSSRPERIDRTRRQRSGGRHSQGQ